MSTSTASVSTASVEAKNRIQSEQSKFVQHLATYPALTALAGLVASFPVAKIFASNAIPLLHAIHERSKPVTNPLVDTASPYLHKLDNAGDAILNKVDERFPALQNFQPNEAYEEAQNYIGSIKGSAKNVYDTKVAQPVSNVAGAAHDQYTSIYNSNLKNGIAPINNQIESCIDHYLPAEKELEAEVSEAGEAVSNEFKRTYKLARVAVERAGPKLAGVYSTKLNERTEGTGNPGYLAKLLALLATGKFLSVESYHEILNYFGGAKQLEAIVEDVKSKAAEIEDSAENAVNA